MAEEAGRRRIETVATRESGDAVKFGFKKILDFTASGLGRRADDALVMESRGWQAAHLGLFVALVIGGLGLFLYGLRTELGRWAGSDDGGLRIPLADWHVLYDSGECAIDPPYDSSCPAHSDHRSLWESAAKRTDTDHDAKSRSRPGVKTWLGVRIDTTLLHRAAELRAYNLYLGWSGVSYRVFLDGSEIAKGRWESSRIPVHLTIPRERLEAGRPLALVIGLTYDTESQSPAYLARGQEAFLDDEQLGRMIRQKVFVVETSPFSLALLNTVVSSIFLFFWWSARRKQEFLYLGLYCAVHAGIQIGLIDFVYKQFGFDWFYKTNLLTRFYEGAFGLFLALAFSRSRLSIFQYGVPFALGAPLFFILSTSDIGLINDRNGLTAKYFVPTCYVLGLASCLLQGVYLWANRKRRTFSRARLVRLLVFTTGFVCLTILYISQAYGVSTPQYVAAHRMGHVAIVLFLVMIVLDDYRRDQRLIENVPVSKYHRRPTLPSGVYGALLKLDLKDSTLISRTLENAKYGEFVTYWFARISEVITRHGGEILYELGDLVQAHFDTEGNSHRVENVFAAIDAVYLAQRDVEERYALKAPLHFKASITYGELIPIWKDSGTRRLPAYDDDGTLMVASQRLMDLDYEIENRKGASFVFAETSELEREGGLGGLRLGYVLSTGRVMKDSDGLERRVTVYRIDRVKAEQAHVAPSADEHPANQEIRSQDDLEGPGAKKPA